MSDFDLYGVFIPSFLVQAILAYFLFVALTYVTDRFDQKGWIAFSGLFKLCLYLLCLLLVHQVFIWAITF